VNNDAQHHKDEGAKLKYTSRSANLGTRWRRFRKNDAYVRWRESDTLYERI